ncbi:MAG: SusE domain-containing protein [Bacteroidota bacterium]
MKTNIKFWALICVFAVALISCKRQIEDVYYQGGTNPVLTASTATVVLEPALVANLAIKFSWTNPEYKITSGANSHDVNYVLEIDTAGANFGSSKKKVVSIAKELSLTYTVAQLNAILGNEMVLQLVPRRPYNMEARVTASMAGGQAILVSNVYKFTASPFPPPPKVPVPTAGTLWITGDAVASNWANPLGAYATSHRFTQLPSLTDYQLIIDMKATGGYKLIQTAGNWGDSYHMNAGGTGLAGTFDIGDVNPSFPSPGVAGSYKLTFNFQLGTYTVVRQ